MIRALFTISAAALAIIFIAAEIAVLAVNKINKRFDALCREFEEWL